eukprot:TRINITY_DN8636_c0_g1_i1.p1 TRINITY_DN8636_c0_g1~~TRINITY_DN8636_c0_g1_i1.p1  ORF type:complete len:168 (-),score=36.11 TRINITY_DN8636_c0_g1_i1:82-585(-)
MKFTLLSVLVLSTFVTVYTSDTLEISDDTENKALDSLSPELKQKAICQACLKLIDNIEYAIQTTAVQNHDSKSAIILDAIDSQREKLIKLMGGDGISSWLIPENGAGVPLEGTNIKVQGIPYHKIALDILDKYEEKIEDSFFKNLRVKNIICRLVTKSCTAADYPRK